MPQPCDVCGNENTYITARATLPRWPYVLMCGNCGASVGCHEGTEIPYGKMASNGIRYLRKIAHMSFDKVWLAGFMSRERAKRWMGDYLKLDETFHISNLNHDQLLDCINYAEEYCQRKGTHKVESGKRKNYERITRPVTRQHKLNAIQADRRKSRGKR